LEDRTPQNTRVKRPTNLSVVLLAAIGHMLSLGDRLVAPTTLVSTELVQALWLMIPNGEKHRQKKKRKKKKEKKKYIAVVDEASLLSKGHVGETLVATGTREALRMEQEAVAEGHRVGLDRMQRFGEIQTKEKKKKKKRKN